MLTLTTLLLIPLALSKTVFIAELFRHGARSPTTYQSWDSDERWGAAGQLTASGMRQHYLLGHELRNRYILTEAFLSSELTAGETVVYSTEFNRTIMSAQSQFTGLYPPGTGPEISSDNSQRAVPPITVTDLDQLLTELGTAALPDRTQLLPVHTDDVQTMLNPSATEAACPMLKQIVSNNYLSPEVAILFTDYADIVETVASELNVTSIEAMKRVPDLWDSVTSNRFHGYEIPEVFTNDTFYERMSEMVFKLQSLIHYSSATQLKFYTSAIFSDILVHLNEARYNTWTEKFVFYSAHDTTVMPIVLGLGYDLQAWAPFASNVFFVMSVENEDTDPTYAVKVLYNDEEFAIPVCDGKIECPLDTFMTYLDSWIYSDFESACVNSAAESSTMMNTTMAKKDSWEYAGDSSSSLKSMGIFAAVLGSVIGFGFLVWCGLLSKKGNPKYDEYHVLLKGNKVTA
jgi:hypothetical protein